MRAAARTVNIWKLALSLAESFVGPPVKLVAVVACGLFVLACLLLGQPTDGGSAESVPSAPLESEATAELTRGTIVLGAASCAGAHCHGAAIPDSMPASAWATEHEPPRWQSSYTVWRAYDPHARAYAVLLEPKGIEIARLLSGPSGPKAHEDSRCLACHATPAIAERTDKVARALQAEGVSCEACHGASTNWIDQHEGWRSGPGHSERLAQTGMTNLADIVDRAETCAGCHVGTPAGPGRVARNMNHDMIAAGHPRLNFDYATYARALPAHWIERDRDVSPPRLGSSSEGVGHWLVGRAVGSAASLKLLASRTSGPWPELAEFNCYACHHSLPGRHVSNAADLGVMTWNEPALLSPLSKLAESPDLQSRNDAVRNMLLTSRTDRAAVEKEATTAAGLWLATARRWSERPPTRQQLARQLADFAPHRWDDACHLYYAVRAIDAAGRHAEDARLEKLREQLRLPRERDGRLWNTPRDYDAEGVKPLFHELFQTRTR